MKRKHLCTIYAVVLTLLILTNSPPEYWYNESVYDECVSYTRHIINSHHQNETNSSSLYMYHQRCANDAYFMSHVNNYPYFEKRGIQLSLELINVTMRGEGFVHINIFGHFWRRYFGYIDSVVCKLDSCPDLPNCTEKIIMEPHYPRHYVGDVNPNVPIWGYTHSGRVMTEWYVIRCPKTLNVIKIY